ncbi:MAG: RsmE family RNA methyltransferase, partial [Candidatus Babeliales bacterium]
VYVVITAIKQSLSVEFCIEKRERMVSQRPSFVVCLPLLKKKAFERACYAAVELGATEIVLVSTDKSSSQRITQHELERLRGIMITAAEQSKSFCIPVLTPCQPLSTVIQQWHQSDEHCSIYADQAGKPLYEVITLLRENTLLQKITVMIGPEGDLTEKEKEMVRQAGALFCSLTPTVLRSHQALSVLLGALKASL